MTYRFRRTPYGVSPRSDFPSEVVQYAEQLFVFDMEFKSRDGFHMIGPTAEDQCCFHYIFLKNGLHGGVAGHKEMAADAWQRWRPRVLDVWCKKAPGTRPLCWWRWDSPLKRIPESHTDVATMRRTMQLPDGLTQAQYLSKHDLLTPYEKRKLPKAAMTKTILGVDHG